MKSMLSILCCFVAVLSQVRADKRIFTNSEGKEVEAEIVQVEGQDVVLKLASGKNAKVPLTSLSNSDQEFVKAWWEENKDKLKPMDVRLIISKKTDRVDRKVTGKGGGNARPGQNGQTPVVTTETTDDIHFVGELKSYVPKDVQEIDVIYTIFKRVSSSGAKGSETEVEEITGELRIPLLKAHGSATFETEKIRCVDFSQKGGNKARELKRETVLGVLFEFSAGGQDFMTQGHPDTLKDRLEELRK